MKQSLFGSAALGWLKQNQDSDASQFMELEGKKGVWAFDSKVVRDTLGCTADCRNRRDVREGRRTVTVWRIQ